MNIEREQFEVVT